MSGDAVFNTLLFTDSQILLSDPDDDFQGAQHGKRVLELKYLH
jgi:hypothetical protein